MAWSKAATVAGSVPVTAQSSTAAPPSRQLANEGDAEFLLRVSTHEAFALPVNYDPQAGIVAPESPSEPVPRLPPEVKRFVDRNADFAHPIEAVPADEIKDVLSRRPHGTENLTEDERREIRETTSLIHVKRGGDGRTRRDADRPPSSRHERRPNGGGLPFAERRAS